MTRRQAVAPEPAAPVCEVCGDETPTRLPRTAKGGLLCCFRCLNMSAGELAVAYGRRLRKAAER